MKLPASEFFPRVNKLISEDGNKSGITGKMITVLEINCGLSDLYYWNISTPYIFLPSRRIVIINRLRIGHTRLTHSYLLAG